MPKKIIEDTPEWYEEYIEKPIQPLVKLLRSRGFITNNSCGHLPFPYVCTEWTTPATPFEIDEILQEEGYVNYEVRGIIDRRRGKKQPIFVRIHFQMPKILGDMSIFKKSKAETLNNGEESSSDVNE